MQNHLRPLMSVLTRIGADPNDSDEVRLQKTLMVSGLVLGGIPAVFIWGWLYLGLGEYLAGWMMIGTAITSLVSIGLFGLTRRFALFRFLLLLLLLLSPFGITIAMGGILYSSAFFLYAELAPLQALLWHSTARPAFGWLLAYLGLVAVIMILQPYLSVSSQLNQNTIITFLVLNISFSSVAFFALLFYFVRQRNLFQARSEILLLNILPPEIAAILKTENRVIADSFEAVSILFADVVDFTPMSSQMTPVQLVELLNEVFSHFDTLVDKFGLEKIKTIGDCYMVASGVPRKRSDHAQVLTRMALEMQDYVGSHEFYGRTLIFRIGINSGSVVAGVIGRKKFIYDLWGDAVNIASRMESHGRAGVIQITQATHELIQNDFICEPHGSVNVKGRGEMEVWHVLGVKV